MNDSLQDVMSAAVEGAARKASGEAPPRRAPQLRAVATAPAEANAGLATEGHLAGAIATNGAMFADDNGMLGRGGLRLAFWVCGFNEALRERRVKGERLSEREESLLLLSRKEFMDIRPRVIGMALERLQAVVHAPELSPDNQPPGGHCPRTMEAFALEALRDFAARANAVLTEEGPEAALAVFGDVASVHEPLAIFQLVFSTAVDLVVSFGRFVPPEARLLTRLGEALEAEVERI